MKVIHTRHSRDRMTQRGVTEEEVLFVLLNCHSSFPGNPNGTQYVGTILGKSDLVVCVTQDSSLNGTVVIKSVFWREGE